MLRSIKGLRKYTAKAIDGEIGTIDDAFFDDRWWTVRYVVIATGGWLVDRRVLVTPLVLGNPKWESREIPVRLTQEQVKTSPPVDTEQPVSRQMEQALHDHYGWPPYWTSTRALAAAQVIDRASQGAEGDGDENGDEDGDEKPGDLNLRSAREVIGYDIQATDGPIGHVDDFIADDETWVVRYLVVDTRGWLDWLPGKQVLISPTWIHAVTWPERNVHVGLSRETVKDSPEFDPSAPVNREYEMRLYDYYGRPKYWTRV